MIFFDEIATKLGFDKKLVANGFKVVSVAFDSVYIEGHKGILVFSSEEMKFRVKGGMVSVTGEKLKLKNFCKQCCVVCGEIASTNFFGSKQKSEIEP